MASTKNRWKAFLLAALCGGAPLATSVTCNPRNGAVSVFRDDGPAIVDVFYDDFYYDDGYYFDDGYYDDGYYDDCLFIFDCF